MKKNPGQLKINLRTKIALIAAGVLLFCVFLESGMRLGGFVLLSMQDYRNKLALKNKSVYRIMCLGESTTQGQYTPFLEETLNQRNTGIRFSVIDKGLNGTRTAVILSEFEANLDRYRPDMVITMMGINDGGAHMPYEPIARSKVSHVLRSFKTYKLIRFLGLHIAERMKSIDFFKPHNQNKETLRFNLADDKAYIEQGRVYRAHGRFSEAEEQYRRAIESNPGNDDAYVELGEFLRRQGRFSEVEEPLRKALEINPRNARAYSELANFCTDMERFSEAEALYKKAIEADPYSYITYVQLGCFYETQYRFPESEEQYKKAIEVEPWNFQPYIHLGKFYQHQFYEAQYRFPEMKGQCKLSEAEKMFNKAIELNPSDDGAYIEMGKFYREQGKLSDAAKAFEKAIEINPGNVWTYGALELLKIEMNNKGVAGTDNKVPWDARLAYYSPITIHNYLKLKAILDARGIRYVCVQYPVRSLEPLKNIFHGNDKGIIFVDNEKVFKDAIAKYGARDYFTDMFGGDFGHCTEKGNRLLAGNIADAILKEVFDK